MSQRAYRISFDKVWGPPPQIVAYVGVRCPSCIRRFERLDTPGIVNFKVPLLELKPCATEPGKLSEPVSITNPSADCLDCKSPLYLAEAIIYQIRANVLESRVYAQLALPLTSLSLNRRTHRLLESHGADLVINLVCTNIFIGSNNMRRRLNHIRDRLERKKIEILPGSLLIK